MTPLMLRQFWAIVESTQAKVLLGLDDTHLVHWLLRQINADVAMNRNESCALRSYIHSKLPLIRDLAEQRVA